MNANVSYTAILTTLALPFLLSLPLVYIYKRNQPPSSYSQHFCKTLLLFPPLVSIIIFIIQTSFAVGLGVIGALSIIRFRNAVKSPLDTVFIFWALSIGIACGSGQFVISTLIAGICSVFFYIIKFLLPDNTQTLGSILKVVTHENNSEYTQQQIENIIKKYAKDSLLINSFFSSKTGTSTLIYSIRISDLNNRKSLIDELTLSKTIDSIDYSNEIASPFVF